MTTELISKTIGLGRYENLSAEEIIAAIARHGKLKEDNGKLVKYLMEHAHWSPLQHISFGFLIETRRSISAQIFRHRSLNGQEWSLRYAKSLGFEEIELRRQDKKNRQSSTKVFNPKIRDYIGNNTLQNADVVIDNLLEHIEFVYNELLNAGVARECARDILPLCTKTTIHITATLRDLLAFLNIRCDAHAQKEIQLIANEIGECLEKELPNVFKVIDWRNGMFM